MVKIILTKYSKKNVLSTDQLYSSWMVVLVQDFESHFFVFSFSYKALQFLWSCLKVIYLTWKIILILKNNCLWRFAKIIIFRLLKWLQFVVKLQLSAANYATQSKQSKLKWTSNKFRDHFLKKDPFSANYDVVMVKMYILIISVK